MAEDRGQKKVTSHTSQVTSRKAMRFVLAGLVACGFLLATCGPQAAFASEGNIDSANKYAWSENAGWINFDSTVTGKGLAGQTVTLTAKDQDGNLLLTGVATATVDGSSNYTILSSDYTTDLSKGTSYLTVTVSGRNVNF